MFGSPSSRSTSGACPPPQPSMWNAWMVRPASTASVSSTDRHSFRPSVWTATCTSNASATVTAVSSAVACAPTSSWILRPAAPAIRLSSSGSGRDEEPRASSAMLSGQASMAACIRRSANDGLAPRFQTGPKSWRDHRRDARGQRLVDDPRRQQVHVRVDRAGRGDQALARVDRGVGADDDVDRAVHRVGVAGAADRGDAAVADADRGLADAEDRVDDDDVRDHEVARAGHGLRHQPVAAGLAEAHQQLVAGPRGVVLDPDLQPGVAEADAVAGGGAVGARVGVAVEHQAPS